MATATTTPENPTVTEEFRRVPIDQIKLASNVRKETGDVTDLAESIKAVGILQPLIVTPKLLPGGTLDCYLLVAGYRRLKAAKVAKLDTVPVMMRSFTDPERVEAQLIENIQRRDIEPVEEGRAMQTLLDLGRTKEQLAKRIGRTTELIGQRLALLGLPVNAVEALNRHKLTIEDAVQLTKLTDHPEKITEILKHDRVDVGWAVNNAVREIGRDKKKAENEAKLAEAGVAIVKLVRDWDVPAGMARLGDGYAQLKVAVTSHAKLDCHAAAVNNDGVIVYLCTKPKNHPGVVVTGSPNFSAAEKKRRAQEMAEKKIAKAAAESRHGFVIGLLKKTTTARASQRFVIAQLLKTVMFEHKVAAAKLLGLPESDGRNASIYEAFPALLKDEASLLRTAFAVALAIGESTLTGRNLQADPALTAAHLELLKEAGYKLTAWEKEQLAEAREGVKNELREASEDLATLTKKAQQAPLGLNAKDRPVARPAGG